MNTTAFRIAFALAIAAPVSGFAQESIEVRMARAERDIKMLESSVSRIQQATMTIPAIERTVENAVERRDGRIFQAVSKAMTDAGVSRDAMADLRRQVQSAGGGSPEQLATLAADFAQLAKRISALEQRATSGSSSTTSSGLGSVPGDQLAQLERRVDSAIDSSDQVRQELEGVVSQINGSMEILTDDIRTVAEAQNELDGRARSGYGILADAMQDAIRRLEHLEGVLGAN